MDSGSAGGIWDISNADRLGVSEVELVNLMIEGCAQLVKMEAALESGGSIYQCSRMYGSPACKSETHTTA